MSPIAQQGEALLWSTWGEKYPEAAVLSVENSGAVTALWEDPNTKAVWDKHVAETYYYYQEQYTYWAAHGWTTDQSVSKENTDGEAAASELLIEEGNGACLNEWRDGAESQQREEFKTDHDDTLSDHFGNSCTIEVDGSSVTDLKRQCLSAAIDRENCYSDDPHDGGNDRKRPTTSSQQSMVEHTGKILYVRRL